jgi:hypothetical protein
MRHRIDFAVDRGVGLDAVKQLGLHGRGVDLGQIERLVDVVFLLGREDAVMARLGQVETGAAGGAQLGDHFLVVGKGHLDGDVGIFGFELLDQLVRRIRAPGQKAQGFRLRRNGCNAVVAKRPAIAILVIMLFSL